MQPFSTVLQLPAQSNFNLCVRYAYMQAFQSDHLFFVQNLRSPSSRALIINSTHTQEHKYTHAHMDTHMDTQAHKTHAHMDTQAHKTHAHMVTQAHKKHIHTWTHTWTYRHTKHIHTWTHA